MEVNKSHFIATGIGFLMGVCLTIGIFGLMGKGKHDWRSEKQQNVSRYEQIPADSNGDAYITPSGGKYHSLSCGHLNRVSNLSDIKQVNSQKAEEYGISRCKRFYR